MDGDDAAARRHPRHEAARDENYEESQPGHRRAAIGGSPSGVLVTLAVLQYRTSGRRNPCISDRDSSGVADIPCIS